MTDDSPPADTVFDPAVLAQLKIVLVGAQHPGNIGAAARAMKVMGLSQLVLVAPERYPDPEAEARASGADDVLAAATVHESLAAAVADCVLTIGTSARGRHTHWPRVDAREAARRAITQARTAPVALVFGRERSGLTNDELDRCQVHLQVPTNPAYRSLNLAAAVQVICYELRMAAGDAPPSAPARKPVAAGDMEGLYAHFEDVLTAAGFLDPAQPRILMRRLRRLFHRAAPDRIEVNILRGALRALDPRRRVPRLSTQTTADGSPDLDPNDNGPK